MLGEGQTAFVRRIKKYKGLVSEALDTHVLSFSDRGLKDLNRDHFNVYRAEFLCAGKKGAGKVLGRGVAVYREDAGAGSTGNKQVGDLSAERIIAVVDEGMVPMRVYPLPYRALDLFEVDHHALFVQGV